MTNAIPPGVSFDRQSRLRAACQGLILPLAWFRRHIVGKSSNSRRITASPGEPALHPYALFGLRD